MAVTGLLALLDDIGTMAKIAAKKTAGISGDDLAVNSQTLVGLTPERELPIVYQVAKGSLKNKAILIPSALALNFAAPWAILPLLMLGGAFLCYEGVEKLVHKEGHEEKDAPKNMKELEDKKIASAIKTDLILSAEIVVITLGAVAASPFVTQLAVLGAIGIGMTVGIYGLVGGIVKLDDIGLHMAKKKGESLHAKGIRNAGKGLVAAVPYIMKGISFLGTAAMFAVGGGLLLHGIPGAEHMLAGAAHAITASPLLAAVIEGGAAIAAGIVAGFACIPAVKVLAKPMAALSEKLAPVAEACKKAYRRVFKKKSAADAGSKPDPEAAPAVAAAPPPAEAAVKTIEAAPDAAGALNAAAVKPTNDDKPPASPEIKPALKTPPAP